MTSQPTFSLLDTGQDRNKLTLLRLVMERLVDEIEQLQRDLWADEIDRAAVRTTADRCFHLAAVGLEELPEV